MRKSCVNSLGFILFIYLDTGGIFVNTEVSNICTHTNTLTFTHILNDTFLIHQFYHIYLKEKENYNIHFSIHFSFN